MIKPYSNLELRARKLGDTAAFDRASYNEECKNKSTKNKMQNPGHVDEALWKKAKEISKKSYGEVRYAFVSYIYQKMGGTFG